MDLSTILILFFFGAIWGSFLNVVALRYDPDRFLFSSQRIGGRSACVSCHRTLRWFELIPLFSFLIQQGKCRRCHVHLSWRYFVTECISGGIFLFVVVRISEFNTTPAALILLSALWIAVFLLLFLITLIDIRFHLIPDEANILLGFIGIVLMVAQWLWAQPVSLLELLVPGPTGVLASHIFAAALAALFFGALILITRGRGMGMGDVKLAMALGFVFGWPDVVLVIGLAFIIGALWSVAYLARKTKTMKSEVAFGPFLAAASAVVFFFGSMIIQWYLAIFTQSIF